MNREYIFHAMYKQNIFLFKHNNITWDAQFGLGKVRRRADGDLGRVKG